LILEIALHVLLVFAAGLLAGLVGAVLWALSAMGVGDE